METAPWEATGWPVDIFTEVRTQRRKVLHCGRKQCRRVLRDPWQLECGHRYCRACLDLISELPPEDRVCYLCIQDLMYEDEEVQNAYTVDFDTDIDVELKRIARIDFSKAYEDKPALREINRLNVKCPWNYENDDIHSKQMKVKEIEAHMKSCKYREVKCELCSQRVQFRHYDKHCHSECPHREVLCPHTCGTIGIMAKDLNEHEASCARRKVCRICCNAINTTLHQHLLDECEGACPLDCGHGTNGRKIVEHLQTPSLLGIHMALMLWQLVTVSNCQRGRPSWEGGLLQPFDSSVGKLEVALAVFSNTLNRLAVHQNHFKSQVAKSQFIELTTLDAIEQLEKSGRIGNARLTDMKLKLDEARKASSDGHLIWKISPAGELLLRGWNGEGFSLNSPALYTDVYGYKLRLRLSCAGADAGQNSHLQLFVVMEPGKFDPILSWPFRCKMTVQLVWQEVDDNTPRMPWVANLSVDGPIESPVEIDCVPEFISTRDLFLPANNYVKDDTVFIEASVIQVGVETENDRS